MDINGLKPPTNAQNNGPFHLLVDTWRAAAVLLLVPAEIAQAVLRDATRHTMPLGKKQDKFLALVQAGDSRAAVAMLKSPGGFTTQRDLLIATDDEGNNPLMIAVASGDFEIFYEMVTGAVPPIHKWPTTGHPLLERNMDDENVLDIAHRKWASAGTDDKKKFQSIIELVQEITGKMPREISVDEWNAAMRKGHPATRAAMCGTSQEGRVVVLAAIRAQKNGGPG